MSMPSTLPGIGRCRTSTSTVAARKMAAKPAICAPMRSQRIAALLPAPSMGRRRDTGRLIDHSAHTGFGLRICAGQIARDPERLLHDLPVAEARKSLRGPNDPVNRSLAPRPHERGQVGLTRPRCSEPAGLNVGADPQRGIPSLDHALPATAPERLLVALEPSPLRETDVLRDQGRIHPLEVGCPGAGA